MNRILYVPKVVWWKQWLGWYSLENSLQPYIRGEVHWDGDNNVAVDHPLFVGEFISSRNGSSLKSEYKGQAFLLNIPFEYLNELGLKSSTMADSYKIEGTV